LYFPRANGLSDRLAIDVSSNTYPRTAKIRSIGESSKLSVNGRVVRVYPERFSPNATVGRKCHGCPLAPRREHLEAAEFLPIVLAMNAVRHYSETIPLGKTIPVLAELAGVARSAGVVSSANSRARRSDQPSAPLRWLRRIFLLA